jgi:hypothetical protein
MLTHEYTYVFGAVDVGTGELDSLILPHVNTSCMQIFLHEVSARHPNERIVMVNGWCRLASKRCAQGPGQHLFVKAAALRTGTQPHRARLGRARREVLS